jgi:type I restriction enzyme S subunit
LITKDGTIGRCAIVGSEPQLCINQSVALIQPRHDLVSSTYLLAYLMTPRVQQTFKGMKKGNAIAHLQITELARLPIPTPSLLDQAKFEAQIVLVASAKQALEIAVSKADTLFNSLQQHAFKGEL